MSLEFDEGRDAAERGEDRSANPYADGTQEHADWNAGYDWQTNDGV